MPAGYLLSYWNRPFFPEFCSDAALDNSVEYDTTVRIAGSWSAVVQVFRTIAYKYSWTHIAVVSDDETESYCWYGAKPFSEVFGSDSNYTFTWLRLTANPTNQELDGVLQQIRARTRGLHCVCTLVLFYLARTYCSAVKYFSWSSSVLPKYVCTFLCLSTIISKYFTEKIYFCHSCTKYRLGSYIKVIGSRSRSHEQNSVSYADNNNVEDPNCNLTRQVATRYTLL